MERIKKSPVTTCIALVIMVLLFALVFEGRATLREASGFFTIALALLFSDDDKFADNFLPKPKDDEQEPV